MYGRALICEVILCVSLTANEVWLTTGTSSTFTSPNYPSNYGNGDSKNWIFCVSFLSELKRVVTVIIWQIDDNNDDDVNDSGN